MNSFLNLSLEYPRPRWLVIAGDFQDVSCIDIGVGASSHDMASINVVLEHWHLERINQH